MSKSWKKTRSLRGSFPPTRPPRRTAPYPTTKEERAEDHKHALDRYEELEQSQPYPTASANYDGYTSQEKAQIAVPPVKSEVTPADRRKGLYQKFFRQVQEDRRAADCVVLSVTNDNPEYSKSLGQSLQERGLSVEMLYLQELGLTRALQDVRADGSPLCILVEQTNIELCSCTVIIFAQSLKIHRNMPQDQALDFVVAEYNRGLVQERPSKDPADIAAETSQMLDDFLDREKRMRHYIPSDVRNLVLLLAEGVHLYPEELETISQYVASRQEHIQGAKTEGERSSIIPAGLGKPPPLLPTPSSSLLQSDHSPSSLQASGLKTRPPPLMPSLGLHSPMSRLPLLSTPPFPRGPPRRFAPPSLTGPRPPLLSRPGGPLLPRPRGPLL